MTNKPTIDELIREARELVAKVSSREWRTWERADLKIADFARNNLGRLCDEIERLRDENECLRLDSSSGGGRQSMAGRNFRDLLAERDALRTELAVAQVEIRHLERQRTAITDRATELAEELVAAQTAVVKSSGIILTQECSLANLRTELAAYKRVADLTRIVFSAPSFDALPADFGDRIDQALNALPKEGPE